MLVDEYSGELTIKDSDNGELFEAYAHNWTHKYFEILSEEDEEIDIQAVEEIRSISFDENKKLDVKSSEIIAFKINELIRAVKLLNKKIKE